MFYINEVLLVKRVHPPILHGPILTCGHTTRAVRVYRHPSEFKMFFVRISYDMYITCIEIACVPLLH